MPYCFQKIGRKNAIATRSSSLPKIIANIKIYFSTSSRLLKLPDGPIISPIPGPTFANAVVAPDIAVIKSNPQKAKLNVTKMRQAKKQQIIVTVER